MDGDQAWRHRGDPLADEAARAMIALKLRGPPWAQAQVGAREGNRPLRRFVDAVNEVPPWADFDRMEVGRRAIMRNAPLTFLVLLAGSVIESFAIARTAKVLVSTGRLTREPRLRIYETASFVRDVLHSEGTRPGTLGHGAVVRVRLLHAYARRFAPLDPSDDALAVNQLDMLHTMMLFSCAVVRGVERFGGRLSADEREGYAHLWRWLGHIIGVEHALLPDDYESEAARFKSLCASLYAPDDNSRALTFAVLHALENEAPFYLPRRALYVVTRRLLGDALADGLRLPRANGWNFAFAAARRATRAASRVTRLAPGSDPALAQIGHAFVEANRARMMREMALPDYAFKVVKRA